MFRWLLVATLPFHLTPALAVDLVDLPLISPVSLSLFLSDPVLGNDDAQTGELGQGDSELVQVGSLNVLIEVVGAAVLATLDQAISSNGTLSFFMEGESVAMPTGGSAAPLIVSFASAAGGVLLHGNFVGTIGGAYVFPVIDVPPRRATAFVIPGDTISSSRGWSQCIGAFCGGPSTSPTPGVPFDLIRYQTLAAQPAPTLFECSDGLDNDGDGAIDLADRQCKAAADNSESKGGLQ